MRNDEAKERFIKSDFHLRAANQAGDNKFLIELFKKRLEIDNANAQNWATLAFLYHETKDKDTALKTLEEAKVAVPSFTKTADCIIGNIKNNRTPDEGCINAPADTVPATAPTKK